MTKLYEIRATVIIKVEADDSREAQRLAEDMAGEIEAFLPTGAKLAQQGGQPALTGAKLI